MQYTIMYIYICIYIYIQMRKMVYSGSAVYGSSMIFFMGNPLPVSPKNIVKPPSTDQDTDPEDVPLGASKGSMLSQHVSPRPGGNGHQPWLYNRYVGIFNGISIRGFILTCNDHKPQKPCFDHGTHIFRGITH